MIDWKTVNPKLIEWVRAGTGLRQVLVVNDRKPVNDRTFAEIRVTETSSNGFMDDVDLTEVEVSPGVYDTRYVIQGQRSFTLEVGIWSDSQVESTGFSDIPLDRLKTLCQLPRLRKILRDVCVGKAEFGDCAAADLERDNRMWSVWIAQAKFNGGFRWIMESEDSEYTIEQVNGTYQIPTGDPDINWSAP